MTDQSGRQGVEVKVAHPVATHNHCGLLLIESLHNLM